MYVLNSNWITSNALNENKIFNSQTGHRWWLEACEDLTNIFRLFCYCRFVKVHIRLSNLTEVYWLSEQQAHCSLINRLVYEEWDLNLVWIFFFNIYSLLQLPLSRAKYSWGKSTLSRVHVENKIPFWPLVFQINVVSTQICSLNQH